MDLIFTTKKEFDLAEYLLELTSLVERKDLKEYFDNYLSKDEVQNSFSNEFRELYIAILDNDAQNYLINLKKPIYYNNVQIKNVLELSNIFKTLKFLITSIKEKLC